MSLKFNNLNCIGLLFFRIFLCFRSFSYRCEVRNECWLFFNDIVRWSEAWQYNQEIKFPRIKPARSEKTKFGRVFCCFFSVLTFIGCLPGFYLDFLIQLIVSISVFYVSNSDKFAWLCAFFCCPVSQSWSLYLLGSQVRLNPVVQKFWPLSSAFSRF